MTKILPRFLPAIMATALLLLSFAPPLMAQTEVSYQRGATQLEDVLPPSPEASSRVKYSDVPFTHSTGAAEYSVPIWELKGRRLTIPISLDYCSNGIRMDEIAGVAGLGWTLNAGGCITREVVYMPDEFTDGDFCYSWPSSQLLAQLLDSTSNDATLSFLTQVLWNRVDTNSDRYSYSVMGLKGSFILDPSGNVVQLQGDGVLIGYTTGGDGEKTFVMTGPDGTVYTFGICERGTRQDQSRDDSITAGQHVDWSASTAWYLTQVTSRDGTESATFSYSDTLSWNRSTRSVTRSISKTPTYNSSGFDESSSVSVGEVKSRHAVRVLTGISLSGFTATFGYGTVTSHSNHSVVTGTDSDNYPRRLSSITVTNPSGTQLVRAETSTGAQQHDGRIVLNGINLYRSGTLDDRWTFTYRTAGHTVSRYSQDWFGYFNGENGDWITSHPGASGAGRTDLCPYEVYQDFGYNIRLRYGAPDPAEASYMMLTEANHDGARTAWSYEGCATGGTVSMNGGTVAVSAGVRVKDIRVYDGNTLKRVRSFSYSSPAASTSALPLQEVYLRTSARIVDTTPPEGLPDTGTGWTFTLHETPVTDGLSLQSARVWYGSVTEDVSAGGSACGNRTTYTYDTSPAVNGTYNTLARFPSSWEDEYDTAAPGIYPFDGVQSEYRYDGASEPARQICKETYRRNPPGTSGSLVEEELTEYNSFTSSQVLTGYKAVQVMHPLYAGQISVQDIQHYPLYSRTSLGAAPSRVTRTGIHPSGTDTLKVEYGYCARSSFTVPVRRSVTTVRSSDAVRQVYLTYPDTWLPSQQPSWAAALSSAHALSEPVSREWVITSTTADYAGGGPLRSFDPSLPPGAKKDRIEMVTEYSYFSGHLMPSRRVEYVNGAESWTEEILSRDVLGNPASVKEKGRPVTSVAWSYNGLHPVAVVEGASYPSLVSALGGQSAVNSLTQASSPGSSQLQTLNGLRTASQTSSSLVTTLTYTPGVGLLSRTDPAGIKTSYTYDNGGRLASVKNTQGQTTDEYSYSLLNGGNNRLSATHYTYRSANKGSSSRDVVWWNTLGLRLEEIAVGASGTGGQDLVTAYESDYMLHDDVRTWKAYP
ncbi:MAG: RHS repeat protein, partial [Bacteroidales bacterium]|nr:RHS repeat protein [Bacteroidales bacterium]